MLLTSCETRTGPFSEWGPFLAVPSSPNCSGLDAGGDSWHLHTCFAMPGSGAAWMVRALHWGPVPWAGTGQQQVLSPGTAANATAWQQLGRPGSSEAPSGACRMSVSSLLASSWGGKRGQPVGGGHRHPWNLDQRSAFWSLRTAMYALDTEWSPWLFLVAGRQRYRWSPKKLLWQGSQW